MIQNSQVFITTLSRSRSIGNLQAGKSLAGELLAGIHAILLAVKLLATSSSGKVLSLDFI